MVWAWIKYPWHAVVFASEYFTVAYQSVEAHQRLALHCKDEQSWIRRGIVGPKTFFNLTQLRLATEALTTFSTEGNNSN